MADAMHFYEYRSDVEPKQISNLFESMVEHRLIEQGVDPKFVELRTAVTSALRALDRGRADTVTEQGVTDARA